MTSQTLVNKAQTEPARPPSGQPTPTFISQSQADLDKAGKFKGLSRTKTNGGVRSPTMHNYLFTANSKVGNKVARGNITD